MIKAEAAQVGMVEKTQQSVLFNSSKVDEGNHMAGDKQTCDVILVCRGSFNGPKITFVHTA